MRGERETQIELAGEQCKERSREKKANKVKGNGRGERVGASNVRMKIVQCASVETETRNHAHILESWERDILLFLWKL